MYDIHNRVKIGNESSADIFVSIHLNKIPQNQYWGWQCFYNQNEKSKILAENLQNNLNLGITGSILLLIFIILLILIYNEKCRNTN